MNYIEVYNRITGINSTPEGYTENHHIWPKSLGGGNEPENLVRLSAKAHLIAHRLLCKIFPDCRELALALEYMCKKNTTSAKGVYISPKVYKTARENFAKAQSELALELWSSPEYCEKQSESRRTKWKNEKYRTQQSERMSGSNNPMYGKPGTRLGKHDSDETREKKSAVMKVTLATPESRARRSAANRESNNPRYDHTQYQFTHEIHGERMCTQYELRTEFGLAQQSLSAVCRGRARTNKGWRCLGPAEVV